MQGKSTYKVLYNNKDISADISSSLISLDYTDNTSGQSDELSIVLENSDGKWSNSYMPERGAQLEAQIIQDGKILECGVFQVDGSRAIGNRYSGDIFTIKGLGSGIKENVRTFKSQAHSNKTLKQIVATIAEKYGYTVVGKIPNVVIGYHVQHRKTSLRYLTNLAAEYGLQFTVKGKQLVFTSIFDLESGASVYRLKKNQLISYDIEDKTTQTYLEATTQHYSTKGKKTINYNVISANVVPFKSTYGADSLHIYNRVENVQQAELMAKAALYKANTLQQEGTITIPGNILIVAGVNIELTELGYYSGFYHCTKTIHRCSKNGGYEIDVEVKRIGLLNQ